MKASRKEQEKWRKRDFEFVDFEFPAPCPWCARPCDMLTSPVGDTKASAGDIIMCIGCGRWGVLKRNGTIAKPTPKRQREIDADPRCQHMQSAWEVGVRPTIVSKH